MCRPIGCTSRLLPLGAWTHSLDRVVGVWHRGPSQFAAADSKDAAELRAGVGGVLAGLPYLNHPAGMAVAGFKPYPLAVAGRCGLPVPETVVSTMRPVGRALADRLGGQGWSRRYRARRWGWSVWAI